MKTILSLVFIFWFINPIGQEEQFKFIDYEFLNFMKAYEHIRKWEGNYSYLEFDAGGETYAGITRNYNKDWVGWIELDKIRNNKIITWNTYIPELEKYVRIYYYEKWKNENYNKIKEPLVASYLFDYSNTGIIAIKHLKEMLRKNGYCVSKNLKLDDYTVSIINEMDANFLIENLKKIRKDYYYNVTVRKPELEIYLKGWLNRAESVIS